jgi:hypothetical protein
MMLRLAAATYTCNGHTAQDQLLIPHLLQAHEPVAATLSNGWQQADVGTCRHLRCTVLWCCFVWIALLMPPNRTLEALGTTPCAAMLPPRA